MSSPDFIRSLTESYMEMLLRDINEDGELSHEEIHEPLEPPKEGVSTIKEILTAERIAEHMDKQLDAGSFATMILTGGQGSGKSTIARTLAHNFHQKGFVIAYSSGFDILDAPEKTVAMAKDNKNIMVIIDDASYVFGSVSGRASSRLKNWFGVIRHSLGGARIVLLVITHVQTGIPPILRNSNIWIYSAPNASEYDSMVRIYGKHEKARNELEDKYNSVSNIQKVGLEKKDIIITYKGHRYAFKWGNKEDPGNGRIMLAIMNGKAALYNSINEYCGECETIAFNPHITGTNYTNLNKTKAEIDKEKKDKEEAEKRGTQ